MTSLDHHIVWFKRDLRVEDHRPLAAAARRGPVVPLYVIEPGLWAQADASARHWRFVAQALTELNRDLTRLGQPLIVRAGDICDILSALTASHPIAGLWSHEETGTGWTFMRDRQVGAWAKANGVAWTEIAQHGVIRCLKSRNGWAQKWDRLMGEPITPAPGGLCPCHPALRSDPVTPPQTLRPDPHLSADLSTQQPGGRTEGLRTIDSFLSKRGRAYRKAMSSPAAGAIACSRISPYLAFGCLSMREVAQAGWQRQRYLREEAADRPYQDSLKSFSSRLHWHCHFIQKLEDMPDLDRRNMHPAYNGLRPLYPQFTESERARLEAWRKGETGLPFVDACMRMLNTTGWMNFRMRAMLMAVSSYHLWLDWRAPGEHMARMFTDYEPGIHWAQTQMQSGTTGINTVRIYNPVKQGYDQDPDGSFIRRWVPELGPVPDDLIHEPWRWEDAARLLGKAYPHPILDHLEAAKEARQKIWGMRKSADHRASARAIQDKHGSRKSGISNRGSAGQRKRARKSKPAETNTGPDQPTLF